MTDTSATLTSSGQNAPATRAIEILTELVNFRVLGGESNLEIAAWIENHLRGFGVEVHSVWNAERTKRCLHCRIGPAADGGVVLSGHMDVVPVEGQPWDTDPFRLTERDGLLYGRGSCDMKGFLACCLASVPTFLEAGLRRPVYFAFSFDEEIGCMAGDLLAKAVYDHYPEKIMGAIIGEPTMLQPIVGQKGINVYKTTVTGSQGHSSRILDEVDAIHEAAHLIVWLENKMKDLAAHQTDDRFYPNHTSIHVGLVRGGQAFNIIANKCWFDWDYRTIPADDPEQLIEDFFAFCRAREALRREVFPGFKITHEPWHPPVPALDTADDAPIAQLILALTGREQTGTVAFAAEAGQFARNGIPAVICGPGDIAQAHRANEFVAIDQLAACVALLGELAKSFTTATGSVAL